MLPWQKGIPPRTLSSISTGKFSGTTYRSFLVHPFSNRRRNSCTMVASQLNLAGAREVVIPVLFLFLPDRSPERSRENRRRSALLDSPPGSGHMKQSRDRGTQKSINRMENASNRAGIVEISTLVEGKGERGKTGEVVQRWNPLAAGIWLPATVARILDASPARGHEAKPVPKDLHCTRSLQVNPGDCRNAKIKSGNGGVNPGLTVFWRSGPGPPLHAGGRILPSTLIPDDTPNSSRRFRPLRLTRNSWPRPRTMMITWASIPAARVLGGWAARGFAIGGMPQLIQITGEGRCPKCGKRRRASRQLSGSGFTGK